MTFKELVERKVKFAVGGANRGRVENHERTWQWLHNVFSDPTVTGETFAEYLSISDDARNLLKNCAGYWIGGQCEGGVRSRNTIMERWCITFDVDDATPERFESIKSGSNALGKLVYLVHTSRKHTPEKPRFRVVFPVHIPVPIDTYEAVVRILAWKLDPTMNTVDHVSFRPAQMMYFPSVSKDMREHYQYFHNEGAILDWQKMLAKFDREHGDHTDFDNLPRGTNEKNARSTQAQAEDPREKGGLIGAFCRQFTVEEAIAEFIPEVYIQSDDFSHKPRYTYAGGSGSNGVVVEDGGLFIYSHHGTDPCGDRLRNAFDMVKLHLFSDLDEKERKKNPDFDPNADPRTLPSYAAMMKFVGKMPAVVKDAARTRYMDTVSDFADEETGSDEIPEPELKARPTPEPVEDRWYAQGTMPGEKTPYDVEHDLSFDVDGPESPVDDDCEPTEEGDWFDDLSLTEKGAIRANVDNVRLILENDVRYKGKIAFNEMTHRAVIRESIDFKNRHLPPLEVHDKVNGEPLLDWHDTTIRTALQFSPQDGLKGYGLKVPKTDLGDCLDAISRKNRFNPVVEYLNPLVWDGVMRLERICIDFFGTPDTPYHRQCFRLMILAAVCRAYEPGHKFDTAMVLEGPQGIRKSTFLAVLGKRRWFKEIKGDLGEQQKVVEQMAGCWIAELAEMAAWNRSEANDGKSFLSSQFDTVRLPYMRREETFPRRCVFFGTTNDEEYLRDLTGNRRILPVRVTVDKIDTEGFEAIVDQVWAEGVHIYRAMRAEMPRHLVQDLPLELGMDAVGEALSKQEGAIDTGVAGEFLPQILDWANTPKRLSGFTGKSRTESSFADLTEAKDKMFRLTRMTLLSAWVDGLDREERTFDGRSNIPVQTAFKLMCASGEWQRGRRNHARFIYRTTSTPEAVVTGYEEVTDPDVESLV